MSAAAMTHHDEYNRRIQRFSYPHHPSGPPKPPKCTQQALSWPRPHPGLSSGDDHPNTATSREAVFVFGPDAEIASMPVSNSMSDGNASPNGHMDWERTKSGGSSPQRATPVSNQVSMYANSEDDGEGDDPVEGRGSEDHENAFVVLLRISFLVPPLSIVAALYSLVILLFSILAAPLRLCPWPFLRPAASFSTQISHLLLPLLHKHQSLISTPSPAQCMRERHPYYIPSNHANNNRSNTPSPIPSPPKRPSPSVNCVLLLAVHLLSPLLIIPILFAAWIAACFWVFAMILGNPDGTERRDDGRAAVLGVRNWWRIWLSKADVRRGKITSRTSSRGGYPQMRSNV